MNILPKKSWHVLSRKNILKVRKDEAEARRIEEEKAKRAAIAEQEARIELMRKRTRVAEPKDLATDRHSVATLEDMGTSSHYSPPKHINFFEDVKTGIGVGSGNVEHEAEKKAEQEKYEKRLGILTYLVDKDASESQPWYMKKRKSEDTSVTSERKKVALDPLIEMQSYVKAKRRCMGVTEPVGGPVRKKVVASGEMELPVKHHKKHKKPSKHRKHASGPSMEELRKERTRREEAEKARTEALLRKFHGTEEKEDSVEDIPGRYNSQFNPHLARRK